MVNLEKAKPILFNGEMVRAILESRKTQTRRPVKKPKQYDDLVDISFDLGYPASRQYSWAGFNIPDDPLYWKGLYRPDDILYVREAWRIGAWNEDKQAIAVDYRADDYSREEWIEIEDEDRFKRYWIQCTEDAEKAGIETNIEGNYEWYSGDSPCRWRPSIHMPKEAARLFLKVIDVRVERLQEISKDDANEEGYLDDDTFIGRHHFCIEWDEIYKEKGYGWDENPYVWVIEFEKNRGGKI